MSGAGRQTGPAIAAGRTGREKVAILLLALGTDLGTKLLQRFDSAELKAIMSSAASLGAVDKDDLDFLVDDFAAHFAKAIGLGTDFESMRSLVEKAFAPADLAHMLGDGQISSQLPVWQRLASLPEKSVVGYLQAQHPQTASYILSKLDPDLAARCLSGLAGDFRMTVARRLLRMEPVSRDVQFIVERSLEQDLLAKGNNNVEADGRNRLAAMLNKLDRELSGSIIDAVADWQPEEAAQLRRMIFSFEDLDKLSQQARTVLFDKLQTDQVVVALRGMSPAIKEVALSSLGARARRMVEAELSNDNGQRTKEGDAARRDIASLVLEMARRGEIVLPSAEDAAD